MYRVTLGRTYNMCTRFWRVCTHIFFTIFFFFFPFVNYLWEPIFHRCEAFFSEIFSPPGLLLYRRQRWHVFGPRQKDHNEWARAALDRPLLYLCQGVRVYDTIIYYEYTRVSVFFILYIYIHMYRYCCVREQGTAPNARSRFVLVTETEFRFLFLLQRRTRTVYAHFCSDTAHLFPTNLRTKSVMSIFRPARCTRTLVTAGFVSIEKLLFPGRCFQSKLRQSILLQQYVKITKQLNCSSFRVFALNYELDQYKRKDIWIF